MAFQSVPLTLASSEVNRRRIEEEKQRRCQLLEMCRLQSIKSNKKAKRREQ